MTASHPHESPETYPSASAVAAHWWTQQVEELAPTGNLADRPTRFGQLLANWIDKQLQHRDSVYVGTDYGPESELREIATEASVSDGWFPNKTMMWVKHDHIVISTGYGAPLQLTWSATGWNPPACSYREYDGEDNVIGTCTQKRYHDGTCTFAPVAPESRIN